MADSFSVKAILSATDSGFSSTLKSCSSVLDKLGNKISGFSFGLLTGAGQAAFSAITSGVSDMVGEINSSNKAWKTFEGNMKIIHGESKETDKLISDVKGSLQDYAQTTVYSSSDMASAYAQLAAVGIDSADKLVKGFGGLAGAAENPAQAMKTLSQQGVQMAAKPTVAWQDFKLMLEQTPAGIAAVAKEMGMSTDEMVTAVQDGEIATNDFFKAVENVGNSEGFTKLATEYKSVDQAMDGLKETLANKLMPAFETVSQKGIKAISGIADILEDIDVSVLTTAITKISGAFDTFKKKVFGDVSTEEFATKIETAIDKAATAVESFITKVTPYAKVVKDTFTDIVNAVQPAVEAIKESFNKLTGGFGNTEDISNFKGVLESVVDVIKKVADFATEHSDAIATLIKYLPAIALGIKGFQVAKTVAPFVTTFATSIGKLAGKGIGGIASKLFGISKSQTKVGTTSATSGAQMLTAAKSYALMGVAVLTIALGFGILAQSAIALSNAGGLAIGVMAGMVIAVVGLGIGMAALLKSLAPMAGQLMPVATAFLAMGAAVLLISAGFALLTVSAIALANAGWGAIAVMVGMVATIALLAVGAAALGTALTAGAVGFIAFGAAVLMVGAGFALLGAGALLAVTSLKLLTTILPQLAESGGAAAGAIALLGAGLVAFAVGAGLAGAACIVLGAGLTVAAVGVVALSVGVLALSVAVLAAAVAMAAAAGGLALLNMALPQTIANATAASVAMVALSAGLLALGAGALVAGAGFVVFAAGTVAADVAIIAFGVSMAAAAIGVAAMAVALLAVAAEMKTIASNAKKAADNLEDMQDSVSAVESGLSALGSKAKSAMSSIADAFDNTADKAKSAGQKVGKNFDSGMQPGLKSAANNAKSQTNAIVTTLTSSVSNAQSAGKNAGNGYATGIKSGMSTAVSAARSGVSSVTSTLYTGYSGAYSAGAYVGAGFANGMLSYLSTIRAAAASMVEAAESAVTYAAQIASPSKLFFGLGEFTGEGYANGIEAMTNSVSKAATDLVSIPQVATADFAGSYSGELSADYDYYRNAEYVIVVPLDIDGREFARATASYTQSELNKQQTRENRKLGKV